MNNIRHIPIVGAGLAGLLAAHAWPHSPVFEARGPSEQAGHRAVLRFRTDAASHLTGIPFKRVKVRKSIWFDGREVAPSVRMGNLYSLKVLGRVAPDRSIWNVDQEIRFIAPSDFYEQLVAGVASRIQWDSPFNFKALDGRVINTAPLPIVLTQLGIDVPKSKLAAQKITVLRMHIEGVEAYQTIYFPEQGSSLYRASLEGDQLIVEIAGEHAPASAAIDIAQQEARAAFGLSGMPYTFTDYAVQPLGKIEGLPDDERKALLFKLTSEHGVYSLGRFATWRNVLLDNVIDDISAIKRLLATDRYGLRQHAAR